MKPTEFMKLPLAERRAILEKQAEDFEEMTKLWDDEPKSCWWCNGSGFDQDSSRDCNMCNGTGLKNWEYKNLTEANNDES